MALTNWREKDYVEALTKIDPFPQSFDSEELKYYPFINCFANNPINDPDPESESDRWIADLLEIPLEDLFVLGDDNQHSEILLFFINKATSIPIPNHQCEFLELAGVKALYTSDHGYCNYFFKRQDLEFFGVY